MEVGGELQLSYVGRAWKKALQALPEAEFVQPHHEVVDEEVFEFDGLQRDDLRAGTQILGVTASVVGKWRPEAELRQACAEKTKALQALPEAASIQAHHDSDPPAPVP